MNGLINIDAWVLVACVVIALMISRLKGIARLPLPPGPKPLPIMGNFFQLNITRPWLTYTHWRKKYGDLIYFRLLGLDFIVVNSEKVARALMDQRSAIYSDRPFIATNKLFGVDFSTVMLSYHGTDWKLHRKMFHHALRLERAARYYHIHTERVRALLKDLLDDPSHFEIHIQRYVASNVMAFTYGYNVAPRNDPMVANVKELVDILAKALSPERSAILSAFPILIRLPSWLPGPGSQRDAARARDLAGQVLNVPFNLVKKNIDAGVATHSMVSDCLAQIDEKDDQYKQETAIKEAAATAFIAGFESSTSMLHTFILAMILYPEVQAKGQAEIDSVIGTTSRLPEFNDRPLLPYIDAILRELLRWIPVVPLGIPHATSKDDVYDGRFIPKGDDKLIKYSELTKIDTTGTLVINNVWAMSRDESKHGADVEEFRPERHLTAENNSNSQPISADPIFGLGRRICPGRFTAEAVIWIAIVNILATFRIVKSKDILGEEINVKKEFTAGIAIQPVHFSCTFVSRSEERASNL
ncbi:cytochrome P450 [Suillus bovinus]|uniref:cytochrome P450 n=1 Tax=Suillus bovinus TaxID=48563 RepID=UPI001B872475|nr:cytochrome P450 [Suillus bovinus]KAG2145344.1 cytochrome P450 [Suillus bovinus]